MKKCSLFCVLIMTLILGGCAYCHVQRPLDKNYDNTTLGGKMGRSENHIVLWLFAWGDGGTKAAAQQGGITTITHADSEYTMVLFGLYTRVTTVVYGD